MSRLRHSVFFVTGISLLFVSLVSFRSFSGPSLQAKEKETASLFNHPDHKEWDRDMKVFWYKDEINPVKPGGTIFVGSSSILFWDLKKSFPGKNYLNRGFGGSEIDDSIHFAEILLLRHKPSRIVMYAGDNDIARKKSAEDVVNDFKKFEKLIHEQLPETEIYYISIKPSISRWKLSDEMKKANEGIEAFCQKDQRLEYLDMWNPMIGKDGMPREDLFIKDGLHLNEKGYELWTSILEPHLDD